MSFCKFQALARDWLHSCLAALRPLPAQNISSVSPKLLGARQPVTLEGDERAGRFGSDASLASASQRSLPKLIVVIKTKETATRLITFTSKPCASDTTDPLPVSGPHGGRRGGCPHRRLPSSSPGTRLRQSLNLQSSKLSLFSFAGELTETAVGSLGGRGVPGTVEELTGQGHMENQGTPRPGLPACSNGGQPETTRWKGPQGPHPSPHLTGHNTAAPQKGR